MKFFTNKVRYSILAGLAAYGTYHLALNFIGIGFAIQDCSRYSEGTISIICHLFGLN
ncbi:hypothetical protein [Nitrosopumilus sp.]|uniref:hypothetical protein n=1 Tax=Nitrosopumilus sp. TaxID=2024843 RepID=UPI003B598875